MKGGKGFAVGQASAVSENRIRVAKRSPALAIPHFHGEATLGRHPSSHEETADIIEMQRPPSAQRAWLNIPRLDSAMRSRKSCFVDLAILVRTPVDPSLPKAAASAARPLLM